MTDSMNCKYCREDLSGKKYVKQEEKPVCVRCCDRFCANTCTEYRHVLDSKELQHKGPYWHTDCFRCYKCYKLLAKESFSAKEDGIICGKCSSREDAPRCHICYKSILAGSENVEYKGDVWHEDCFTCFHCKNNNIRSQSFLTKGTDINCNLCHEKKFARICVSNNQALTTGGLDRGHSECFVCCSCQKPLAGTRFTSHEEKAFCVDCYKTTVAKKGSGCQNPITGFVKATNVVNYEGSSWHEYYFNCKKCSLSVANKCIVANSRDIFCSECAKKL
ncbi:four and a half LIM domains protein 1-like [Oncorhynchus mykiss]|uniref:Four and a half LIM domains 1b n=1 Tax=Oncorhynchus mykiss TaxID=8022 RepID=A0A8C7U362_ONCMY|nr:four and a half LIM domains protein 1-like [Oncorhynchus mykiss]